MTPVSDRYLGVSRLLLISGTISTAGVAVWLLWVIALVLPSRDPTHIPMWSGVAAGCFFYSVLSGVYLRRKSESPWNRGSRPLNWGVVTMSVCAVSAGILFVTSMIARTEDRFEGYILLIGLVLVGHGMSAILHVWLSSHVARRSAIAQTSR
jgi:hypothetical protein